LLASLRLRAFLFAGGASATVQINCSCPFYLSRRGRRARARWIALASADRLWVCRRNLEGTNF
jgi:hypothetical protein